ncbi:Uncharacterised protein [Mycobacterium tuberculosis]|nr:Uncharacterised protein [Mycobacterium tuberculosis]
MVSLLSATVFLYSLNSPSGIFASAAAMGAAEEAEAAAALSDAGAEEASEDAAAEDASAEVAAALDAAAESEVGFEPPRGISMTIARMRTISRANAPPITPQILVPENRPFFSESSSP